MSTSMTVEEFQEHLVKQQQQEKQNNQAMSQTCGIVLDIDETLSATNVAWFDRLEQLFGIPPENLSIPQLIQKYSLAQNVPHWNSQPAALDWMQGQRDSIDAQKGLPLIEGSLEGVAELLNNNDEIGVPILGYLTVRPVGVAEPTIQWLIENGFPKLPVIAKPNEIPFPEGNQWKGRVLNQLYPFGVTGIVDDNPKVPVAATPNYSGKVFLFGHSSSPKGAEHAIPCPTWNHVVQAIRSNKDQLVSISSG